MRDALGRFCIRFGLFCGHYGHTGKDRHSGCGFHAGDGIANGRDPAVFLADGLCGRLAGRTEIHFQRNDRFPGLVRSLHRSILVVLFQGAAAGECQQGDPDRQVQYGPDDRAVFPVAGRIAVDGPGVGERLRSPSAHC